MVQKEIKRKGYLNELMRYKDVDLIKVITGMRRAGKSILMRQFRAVLESTGVSKECIVYIDMDSIQNDIYRDGRKLYSNMVDKSSAGRLYILIDEVQMINQWVRVIESLRNDIDCDLYITGSNAHMLSSEIATLLTGRSITLTLLPFSLNEVCELNGGGDPKITFVEYIRHGGIPILRPGLSEDTTFQLLNELKSDIILKDICNRSPGTDPLKIRKVIDYLYSEIGNPISISKISVELGMSTSVVSNYLRLITDSMLFTKVERYDLKGKKVLSQEPKYYCTDTGMRYSQPISSERDMGKVLENIVYLELVRRGCRVYVGRPESSADNNDRHLEIDFIVIKEGGNDYYQVTQTLIDPTVFEREITPLRKVTGRGERYILTYDDRPRSNGQDAVIMNIVEFLTMESGDDTKTSIPGVREEMLWKMVEYRDVCLKIANTEVNRTNFDHLSYELQGKFFDLQSFIMSELEGDGQMQEILARIRVNNVRIFNSMIGCVNVGDGKMFKPSIETEIGYLEGIIEEIGKGNES